jgi:hypothetical protein
VNHGLEREQLVRHGVSSAEIAVMAGNSALDALQLKQALFGIRAQSHTFQFVNFSDRDRARAIPLKNLA